MYDILKDFVALFFAEIRNLGYALLLYEDGNSAYKLKPDNNSAARAKRRFYI